MNSTVRWMAWVTCFVTSAAACSEPLSIEAFAARLPVEQASISPDGRYVSLIQTSRGRAAAVVLDRQAPPGTPPQVVMGEPDKFHLRWCRFASDTRLLCSFWSSVMQVGRFSGRTFNITRLVGVDSNGSNMKVLLQDSGMVAGEWLDHIVHWHPGPPDTVLLEAWEGLDAAAATRGTNAIVLGQVGTNYETAIFELNTRTGSLKVRQHGRSPIVDWIVDARGQVRIGFAVSGTVETYFARLDGDTDWRRLTKFEAFSRERKFVPIAMSSEDANKAYALATSEGRQALWLIDLTDKSDPELVFAHPAVAVSEPLLSLDGRLLGVHFDTEYPNTFYTDQHTRDVIKVIDKVRPNTFNSMVGASDDGRVFVIESHSDISAATFSVFDSTTGHLSRIDDTPSDLPPSSLARMTAISYPARDGTEIPGYLSRPRGGATENLPLIVMPHGGPIARDTWGWFFLRQFLTSRGYAVLQMNFRGSGGYSDEWFFSAHQDWGGLSYDDVVDGTHWAIGQGIADPSRVCIVGWSFGGYLALLGAQRNSGLFRCSISIAGVSDLGMLIDEHYYFSNFKMIERQIGTDRDKLRRDSPRLHSADFNTPVLLIHGSLDAIVPPEHAKEMDAALSAARKPHRLVMIAGADHSMTSESFRTTLLREVEAFLHQNLATPTPASP